VGVFLLSCTFLTTTYDTTFVFDRPLSSIVFVCLLSGISLVFLGAFFHYLPASKSLSHKNRYSVISLAEPGESPLGQGPLSPSSPISTSFPVPKSRKYGKWIRIAAVSTICCIRVEIYRRVTIRIECAPTGYAVSMLTRPAIDHFSLASCCLARNSVSRFFVRLLAQPTISTNWSTVFR
jgi:hypothetical protein